MPNEGYTDRVKACLDQMVGQELTIAQIVECSGEDHHRVQQLIPRLLKQGEPIVRVKRGVYVWKGGPRSPEAEPAPAPAHPLEDGGWEVVHEWADGSFIMVNGDDAYVARKVER